MLGTLVRPTAGRAAVAGFDVLTDAKEVRRRIGFAMQDVGVDELATGSEFRRAARPEQPAGTGTDVDEFHPPTPDSTPLTPRAPSWLDACGRWRSGCPTSTARRWS
jgi:hypothetical protein